MDFEQNPTAAKDKIIVALDVPSADEALRLSRLLAGEITWCKIGLQLFTACGPRIVREIRSLGLQVFLDLKFHDIPNTVQHAVQSAIALEVQMLTVHASGGLEMLQAAAEAAQNTPTCVLGVTVLTSSDADTLRAVGVPSAVDAQVQRLAELAIRAGLGGLVASSQEAAALRASLPTATRLVIPGIRPADAESQDQKRVMTPADALAAGADYLVIGRPITAAADPLLAVEKIIRSIEQRSGTV